MFTIPKNPAQPTETRVNAHVNKLHSAPTHDHRPVSPLQVDLEQLADDPAVRAAHIRFNIMAAAYGGQQSQPNYNQLDELIATAGYLRAALLAPESAEPISEQAIAALQRAAAEKFPRTSNAHPMALPVLLRHLDAEISNYSEGEQTLARFIAVHAALTHYEDALLAQPRHGRNGRTRSLESIHQQAWTTAYGQSRLNPAPAPEPPPLWKRSDGVFSLLNKPQPQYRSAQEEQDAFKALFLGNRIIQRGNLTAEKCEELWALYTDQLHAVRKNNPWLKSIPMTDLIAIRTYSVASNELNEALRNRDEEKIAAFAPYIQCLLSGLNQMPAFRRSFSSTRGEWLHRGVRLSAADLKKYVPGAIISEAAFTSTTSDPNSSYCRLKEKYNVQLRIFGKGKNIAAASLYAHLEDEVLFPPGTQFEVVEVKYVNEGLEPDMPRVNITLREIEPSSSASGSGQAEGLHSTHAPAPAV